MFSLAIKKPRVYCNCDTFLFILGVSFNLFVFLQFLRQITRWFNTIDEWRFKICWKFEKQIISIIEVRFINEAHSIGSAVYPFYENQAW